MGDSGMETLRPRAPDRTGGRRSTTIDTWLAALVVACSVASLLCVIVVTPRATPNGTDRLLVLYAAVAAELPPAQRIGFVSRIADRDAAGAVAYAAQSALAPRLLDPDLDSATFAITTPDAPPAIDDDPRLRDFAPIATAAGGVRIYRRRE
jgi:hypothetical protein